ncbi:MAG: hypothetical protein MMC23_005493 [Stictis urceolatum]|nr:hypothetical protein [Stictis urceolata]
MSSESIVSSDDGGLSPISSAASTEAAAQLLQDDNAKAAGIHKRSLSGSLLARFAFLRSAQETRESSSEPPIAEGTGNGAQPRQNGVAAATLPKKGRSRKGSLRKTALLGGRTLRMEKKAPGLETIASPRLDTSLAANNDTSNMQFSPESDDSPTPRASYDRTSSIYATANDVNSTTGRLSSDESLPAVGLRRKAPLGDMSTTDEEEALNNPRNAVAGNGGTGPKPLADDSYFSIEPGIVRRRSAAKKSPLATIPVETVGTPEEWDYAETEWWGWVVLVVTWVVFVVGMGSCFEVWSWAWDVGETPYAPPELEDDPTLPIVGYYPALIILTGVMAWVWVIIAWVGMKYFKHAKISGEGV